MDCSRSQHPEFRYKTEFQSHDPEFDYLKSLEIEEKINKVRWCQTKFLLSTNDKTIKCWKVQEKVKKICEMNVAPSKSMGNGIVGGSRVSASSKVHTANGGRIDKPFNYLSNDCSSPPLGISSLHLPVVTSHETSLVARCRRVYGHAHDYHINSISINRFEEPEAPGSKSFFTDIIASISDIKFAKNCRHILSRDYMTLKLWDINMDSGPVATFYIHEYLRPKLYDLYENDSIFDNFECCTSGDGLRLATGSYSNLFRVFGCSEGSTEATTLEATKNPTRRQVQTPSRSTRSFGTLPRVVKRDNSGVDINGTPFDFTTKLLHLAWHPTENSLACAASNSLYMYYAR